MCISQRHLVWIPSLERLRTHRTRSRVAKPHKPSGIFIRAICEGALPKIIHQTGKINTPVVPHDQLLSYLIALLCEVPLNNCEKMKKGEEHADFSLGAVGT